MYVNEQSRVKLEKEKNVHKVRAQAFHRKLKRAKQMAQTDPTVETLTFDFMQHVPVPHLPDNDFFYLRQMWLFTFGIHQHSIEKPFFYMWSECDAKHGVNDVLSCLMHFVENNIPDTVNTLILFSDAYTGQNRNFTMVYFLTALVNCGRFEKIYHNFPVRGHSFLPCDSDFSHLGKIKRMQEHVATPSQWINIFSERYTVIPFEDIPFYDFVSRFRPHFKKSVAVKGVKFLVTKYKRFQYEAGRSTVAVSESLKAPLWNEFCLLPAGVTLTALSMPVEKMYTAPSSVPIKQVKLNYIKKLYKYLQPDQVAFYDSLTAQVDDAPSDSDADKGNESQ